MMATKEYSAQDVKGIIEDYLHAQADAWREESRLESLKGAADRTKVDTLVWGADRLEAMASQIHRMPMEEEIHPDEAALVDDGSQPANISTPATEVEDLGAPQNPESDEGNRLDDFARTHEDIEEHVTDVSEGQPAPDESEDEKSEDNGFLAATEPEKPAKGSRSRKS